MFRFYKLKIPPTIRHFLITIESTALLKNRNTSDNAHDTNKEFEEKRRIETEGEKCKKDKTLDKDGRTISLHVSMLFARERKKYMRARVPNICYCCCCCCRCFSGSHVCCCHRCVLHVNAAARHRLLHLTACLLFLSSPPPSQKPHSWHLFRQSHSRPARRRFLRVPARSASPKDASRQVRRRCRRVEGCRAQCAGGSSSSAVVFAFGFCFT